MPSTSEHRDKSSLGTNDGRLARLALSIPWNPSAQHRLDPQNGITLNALHDRAFDRGLITFDTDLQLLCAPSLRAHFAEATVAQSFKTYEGKPLSVPTEAPGPKAEYLAWHRAQHGYGG